MSMLRELSKPLWEINFPSLPNVWGISAPWLLSRGYRLYPTWPEGRYESTICNPDHPAPQDLPHPYAYSAYFPGPCNDVSMSVGQILSRWTDRHLTSYTPAKCNWRSGRAMARCGHQGRGQGLPGTYHFQDSGRIA